MAERSIVIIFTVGDIYGDVTDGENPCVSIRESRISDKSCGGGVSSIIAALGSWANGGYLPTGGYSDDPQKIFSSSWIIQDLTGLGYDLSVVGADFGKKTKEQRELADTIDITPNDVVNGRVDLSSGLILESIPDKIITVDIRGYALDASLNRIPSFIWRKDDLGIVVSDPAYASFFVSYLATVDVYDTNDSGDGGYKSIIYSVGACGMIDSYSLSADRCFKDNLWNKFGYPWQYDGDIGLNDGTTGIIGENEFDVVYEPEAKEVDAQVSYGFCSKELIGASPDGIVPPGSCYGGRSWPSGNKCK